MSAPAVPVALASAACFAVASAFQQRAARAEPPRLSAALVHADPDTIPAAAHQQVAHHR